MKEKIFVKHSEEVNYKGVYVVVDFVFEVEPESPGNLYGSYDSIDLGEDGFAFIHSASIKGQNLDLEYNDDDESFLGMDSKTCKQMCERIYDRWSRSMADTIVDSSQSESYILSSSYANGKKQ
jgi:hypothetical protein